MVKQMVPRYAIDMAQVAASSRHAIKKNNGKKQRKFPKPPEKPEKIQALLLDPVKRKHLGPCCKTPDGKICGEKKWGDGKGSQYTDGTIFYECMGCREELAEPPVGAAAADDEFDDAAWAQIEAAVAASR